MATFNIVVFDKVKHNRDNYYCFRELVKVMTSYGEGGTRPSWDTQRSRGVSAEQCRLKPHLDLEHHCRAKEGE